MADSSLPRMGKMSFHVGKLDPINLKKQTAEFSAAAFKATEIVEKEFLSICDFRSDVEAVCQYLTIFSLKLINYRYNRAVKSLG